MSESRKKVLFITYYWPPSGGAGVQRCLKFVKYLPQFGVEPHVYTVENGEYPSIDESLEKDIPNEAIVIKKPIWEPYQLFKILTGKKKGDKVQAGFISDDGKESFVKKLSIWVRGNLLIPDPRRFWIKPSVKFLESYIKENGIETIISSGPPHSMHLIALGLKKRLPNVKWVADFRDPWTDIDFYQELMLTSWADRKHHRLEKEVLQTADEVISVGTTWAGDLEKTREDKVHVITNGYDHEDYQEYNGELDDKFTLSHIGSLNKDRNHPVLWEAMGELVETNKNLAERLRLTFIGPVDISLKNSLKENGLTDFAEFIPSVSHKEVRVYQQKSRVLMLFVNQSPNAKGVLTGKMFEYLAAKRPIIATGPTDGDLSILFDDLGLNPVINFTDKVEMKKQILSLFDAYSNEEDKEINTSADKYSRRNLTKELVKFL